MAEPRRPEEARLSSREKRLDQPRDKRLRLPRLQLLVARALAGLRGRLGLVDWFDYVTRASETFTGTLARGA